MKITHYSAYRLTKQSYRKISGILKNIYLFYISRKKKKNSIPLPFDIYQIKVMRCDP